MTRLVIGLGNPGPEYERTRHNAGFRVVDLLGENLRATYWKDQAGASVAAVRFGEDDLALAKPQTFMNLSGKAVKKLLEAYDVPVEKMIVVHDDIDLPEGVVRAKAGGGHGGNNGLRSIHDVLGTDSYLRVRIGAGRPPGRMDPADWVLQEMRPSELEEYDSVLPTAAACVIHILERGVESAMREYNER